MGIPARYRELRISIPGTQGSVIETQKESIDTEDEKETRPSLSLIFSVLATSNSRESSSIDYSFFKSRYVKVLAIASIVGLSIWGIARWFRSSQQNNNRK